MAEEELKLYGFWGSPFSRRIEMALKLKGIPYQYLEEDITNKSPDLLKYNPVHKKVPVIVHKGKSISESLVILEYIEETWKTTYPLFPEDQHDRATVRFWSRFIEDKILVSLRDASYGGEKGEKFREEAYGHLKVLEEQLKDKRFFGGERVGFLDICANFIGYWIIVSQEVRGKEVFTEDKLPILWKWAEEFRGCPGIKENLPEKDRLAAHIKTVLRAHNSSK